MRLIKYLNPYNKIPKHGRYIEYDNLTLALVGSVLNEHSFIIDVGAHHGALYSRLKKLASHKRHCLIEANGEIIPNLKEKFPEAQVIHAAISNHCLDEVNFYLSVDQSGLSGLKKESFIDHGERREVKCPLRTLDSFEWSHKVDFVKIDVEGAETFVIQGAKKMLLRDSPIIVFEHGKGLYEMFNLNGIEIFDELSALGYSVWALSSQHLNTRPLSRLEFRISTLRTLDSMFVAAVKRCHS